MMMLSERSDFKNNCVIVRMKIFTRRMSRLFNGETMVSSTNGAGTTGYSRAKERRWTPTYTVYKN